MLAERPLTASVSEAAMRQLQSSFRGPLLRAGDAGYDAACTVWNGMISRRPGVIARASGVEDVAAAINVAREHRVLLAVRGGGHNVPGLGISDGGLTLDLSLLRDVQVDPAARIARAQGGATWGDYDRATHAHGLASTGGAISTTGVAGLTLGGGLGWLMRKYGLACDNLRSVQIVTAEGQIRRASASENADLFWGVRGGGGNFGAVTEFEFQVHPVSTILGGMLIHPAQRAPQVLRFYRDFVKDASDELTVFVGMLTAPDGVPVIALAVAYIGDLTEGERVIQPLREFGPPVADQVGPMPYTAQQTMMDEAFPPGLQVYWRSNFLRGLDDGALDALVEQFSAVPSPLSILLLEQFGGAVARVGRDETAFPHRDATFNLAIISRWTELGAGEPHVAWARGVSAAMEPYTSGGVYVNYLGDEGDERIRAAYGSTYTRLAALKQKYDPTNLFRLNQNIHPSA